MNDASRPIRNNFTPERQLLYFGDGTKGLEEVEDE